MAQIIHDVYPYPSRTLHEYILLPEKIPAGVSDADIDLSSPLVKFNRSKKLGLKLNIPVLSAAMQSVTGPSMAIAMATLGGAGVIYRSQPIEEQASMVREVKEAKAGFVVPDVFSPRDKISTVDQHIKKVGYSTFPITEDGEHDSRLIGLLARKDFDPQRHGNMKVRDRMVPLKEIVYARINQVQDRKKNLSLEKAHNLLIESHHGSLPILSRDGKLLYMVFRKDVDEHLRHPLELLDEKRRFVCGAAFDTRDYEERIPALVKAEVDLLVEDTSHAISEYTEKSLRFVKKNFPHIPVIAGNIVTPEGFDFLANNGADAVKVGMGSGYICITQEQIKIGRGQATAVIEVSKKRDRLYRKTGKYIPICSDGGIQTAADMTVALALGADYVMVGAYVAGTDESNSEKITRIGREEGRSIQTFSKEYWGEGSTRARRWMKGRYGHSTFVEGIVTEVPYVGPIGEYIPQSMDMVRNGIRKAGCNNIFELHKKSRVEAYSPLSMAISEKKAEIGKTSSR